MTIPHNFFAYWGGRTALNYARYLTMASFRIYNPEWKMYLYTSQSSNDERWSVCFQDFQFNSIELKRIVSNCEKRLGKPIDPEYVQLADKMLISPIIDPWEGIKYQQRAIAEAFIKATDKDDFIKRMENVIRIREDNVKDNPVPHNYIKDAIENLGVEVKNYDPENPTVYMMPPTSVSDIFSLEILIRYGGFYLDLDQLVLRKWAPIADHYDFVMGGAMIPYIGVFGAKAGSKAAQSILPFFIGGFSAAEYNSSGISALCNHCVNNQEWMTWFKSCGEINHLVPDYWFYPLNAHTQNDFWDGKFDLDVSNSYSVHWFGGNGSSKRYLKELTPKNIMTYDDNCLTRWVRKNAGRKKELCLE
jgi:hypothetical protein